MSVVSDIQRAAAKFRPALGDGTSTLITLHVLTAVIRLGSSLIVSRLFAPEAYGAIGVITSIAYVLNMTTDLGLRAYVTRHPTADAPVLQTVWTVRLIRNLALTAIMFFAAEPLAELYASPQVAAGVRVAALFFVVDSLSSLTLFSNERERRVARLSIIEFARVMLVTVTTIIAAYFLRTYWAVIIGMFVGGAFMIFATYRLLQGPPMRWRLNREHVADMWRFCKIIVPSSILSIFMTQTDKFFLANFFPLAELGKFMLASTIAVAVQGLIGQYVMRVSYPLIAQVVREAPEAARDRYYSSRRRFTLALAFCIGGLIGGGELVVQILFNDLYRGAGFFLTILCLRPLAMLTTHPAQQALIAKGFIRATLTANVVRLAWMLVAGPIAYVRFGAIGVVVVMCLTEVATLPFFWWSQRRFDLFKAEEEALAFAVAGVGAVIGFAAQTAAHWLIAAGYLPSF